MLNYENQPSRTLFNNVTLTNAYTGNQKEFEANGFSKLSLDINYARGAGEAASELNFIIQHSDDKQNWYSLVIDETSTVSTITERVWEVTNTAKLNVLIDIGYIYLRVSAKETGVVTNAGTLSMKYTLSGL